MGNEGFGLGGTVVVCVCAWLGAVPEGEVVFFQAKWVVGRSLIFSFCSLARLIPWEREAG